MRNIDQTTAAKFWHDEEHKDWATTVRQEQDQTILKLYNTEICKKMIWSKLKVAINYWNYPTNTTFARIGWVISYLGYEIKKIKGTPTIINKKTKKKRIAEPNTRYTLQD